MIGRKHAVLEIYDKEQFVFTKRLRKLGKKSVVVEKVSIGQTRLQNKKLTAVIAEEEVLIKIIEIPKVKKSIERDMVRKELEHFYGFIEDIIFSYSLKEELEHSMKILILCINSSKVSWLKQCVTMNNNLIDIFIVQLCFYEIYKKFLKEKHFVLLVLYEGYHYVMAFRDGQFIGNRTVRDEAFDEKELVSIFGNLSNDHFYVNGNSILECVYIVNEENKIQSTIKNRFDKVEDLGGIDRTAFINHLLKKRRERIVSL